MCGLINRYKILKFFTLILITFSSVEFFIYRRRACGLAIIFILLRVDLLLICLSFGPIIVIIALILAAVAVYSSQLVSMIAYCLGPGSGHLISTKGSSLSISFVAITEITNIVAAVAGGPLSGSSSEPHLC